MLNTTGTAQALFADRNSSQGLFRRYARGRVRGFVMRQSMTLMGSLPLALFGAPWIGALAALIVLVGEGVDCLALHAILRQNRWGPGARRIAAVTAGFQGLTIAVSILICWVLIPMLEARFFAAVFLMGAAVNAGLVRRHFPEGAHARLAIYVLTAGGMVAVGLEGLDGGGSWFFLLAVLILVYISTVFISSVERGQNERLRFEAALLDEQAALERSQAALADTARRAERLALVARHANDSVIFTDSARRIEWVNEAFTRTTGYSLEEVIGLTPTQVLNSPDTSPEALENLYAAHRELRPCVQEIENVTKDGRRIWMQVSMTPVIKADGTADVFIAIERDITQARAHAAELSAAREAAEAAARAKAAFLATMSHEMRTPLHGVLGMAELLEETPLDGKQRRYVATMVDSGRALLTIINDVLDLSKLQTAQEDLRNDPFVLTDCIAGAVDLLQPTAQKKGILLVLDRSPDLPRYLGDAGRIRQILLNLIGNAVKFTARGQVSITLGATPEPGHDTIRIAIADTGIGITPERIAHIFDSFTQADASISRQFGGTGLGLTISRLLAERMGGGIEVASVMGEGSVFTLTLRLRRATDAVEASGPLPMAGAPRTRLRVMVAEDNRTNMMIARKILERSVAALAEATNGRIAVDLWQDFRPDLVLMDVSMPEMDGLAATRAIRAAEVAAGLPRGPIHALTAYSSSEEEEACRAAGMDGVLTKPLSRAALFTLLERVEAARPPAANPAPESLRKPAIGF